MEPPDCLIHSWSIFNFLPFFRLFYCITPLLGHPMAVFMPQYQYQVLPFTSFNINTNLHVLQFFIDDFFLEIVQLQLNVTLLSSSMQSAPQLARPWPLIAVIRDINPRGSTLRPCRVPRVPDTCPPRPQYREYPRLFQRRSPGSRDTIYRGIGV